MRNLFRLIGVSLIAAAFLVVGTPAPVSAQFAFLNPADLVPISGYISAINTDVALRVKFIGTKGAAGDPTVAVATNKSISFTTDGSTADTSITNVCGGVAGTLDTSQAACNTYGKLINVINASGNWVAIPGAVLATDSSNTAQTNLSATKAATEGGVAILKLTSVLFNLGTELVPAPALTGLGSQAQVIPYDIRFWLSKGPGSNKLNPNPFADYFGMLLGYNVVSTYASGTSTIVVYGVTPKFTFTGPNATNGLPTYTYSESVRTIWNKAAGATTVATVDDYSRFPIITAPGERLIVRTENSAAMSAASGIAYGVMVRHPNR